MAKLRKVSEESKIGPSIYEPGKKQCWYCLHNKVSTLCNNCLLETGLFEGSEGKLGRYKPAWEHSTAGDVWPKGNTWLRIKKAAEAIKDKGEVK